MHDLSAKNTVVCLYNWVKKKAWVQDENKGGTSQNTATGVRYGYRNYEIQLKQHVLLFTPSRGPLTGRSKLKELSGSVALTGS